MAPECPHGLDQASCADCQKQQVRRTYGVPDSIPLPPVLPQRAGYDWSALWDAAHPDDGLGPWLESRWGGHCRGCGKRFEPGDLIRRYDAEDGYLAECCGGDAP